MIPVNYVTVLVCTVIFMIIGMLWYSKALFGDTWMKLLGKKKEDINKKEAPKMYLITFVAAFIMNLVLAHIIWYAKVIGSPLLGAKTGFYAWIGFVATTTKINAMFEGKPFNLVAINAGYFLVTLLISGAILAAWW